MRLMRELQARPTDSPSLAAGAATIPRNPYGARRDAVREPILINFFAAPSRHAWPTLCAMGVKRLLSLLVVLAGLAAAPAAALASSVDVSATQAYLQANYALVSVARSHLATSEAGPLHVLAQVKRECPGVGAGSPQDPESTQMSDEVIGAMVYSSAPPDRRAMQTFVRAVAGLHWSSRGLTNAVHSYAGDLKTFLSLPEPEPLRGRQSVGLQRLSHAAREHRRVRRQVHALVGARSGSCPSSSPSSRRRQAGRWPVVPTRPKRRSPTPKPERVEHWGDIMNTLVIYP